MSEPFLKWDESAVVPDSKGAFVIEDGDTRLAEMVFRVSGSDMIIYHTEVHESLKGKGVAGKLLGLMVEYARTNRLKVVPLCAYVHTQFERHPDQYADIWKKKLRE